MLAISPGPSYRRAFRALTYQALTARQRPGVAAYGIKFTLAMSAMPASVIVEPSAKVTTVLPPEAVEVARRCPVGPSAVADAIASLSVENPVTVVVASEPGPPAADR